MKKHFIDTIRLIAYRAETSLACIVREKLARDDDARSLVRQILRTSVDLIPNESAQTLAVHLHALSSPIHDAALQHLCAELNSTETLFPGTSLKFRLPDPPGKHAQKTRNPRGTIAAGLFLSINRPCNVSCLDFLRAQ